MPNLSGIVTELLGHRKEMHQELNSPRGLHASPGFFFTAMPCSNLLAFTWQKHALALRVQGSMKGR